MGLHSCQARAVISSIGSWAKWPMANEPQELLKRKKKINLEQKISSNWNISASKIPCLFNANLLLRFREYNIFTKKRFHDRFQSYFQKCVFQQIHEFFSKSKTIAANVHCFHENSFLPMNFQSTQKFQTFLWKGRVEDIRFFFCRKILQIRAS